MSTRRSISSPFAASLALVAQALAGQPASSQAVPEAAGAGSLQSRGQREQFLLSARIVSSEKLEVGVTGSERVTLDDGRSRHDAHVQTIDRVYSRLDTGRQVYRLFRDSYRYNVAASKLDELLGLGMVPVSVQRRVAGRPAAVTWWVDDVLMMELDRRRRGVVPPDRQQWVHQREQARLFADLVGNADYNATNLLIDRDWKLWLIDFSRAFHVRWRSRLGKRPPIIDRELYLALGRLDQETLEAELGASLTRRELRCLLARRDRIVETYEAWIAEHGESSVLCQRHP